MQRGEESKADASEKSESPACFLVLSGYTLQSEREREEAVVVVWSSSRNTRRVLMKADD